MKIDPLAIIFLLIQLIFFLVYAISGRTGGGGGTVDPLALLGLVFQFGFIRDLLILTFVGFGLWLGMIRRYGVSGVGITFLVTALSIQFGIMILSFFVKVDVEDLGSDLSIDLGIITEATYASVAVLISLGALLGTVSPGQMLIIAMIEVFFYGLNWYIVFLEMQALDPGRSLIVHLFGATFGIAAGVLTAEEDKKPADELHSDMSDLLSMFGTLIIWLLYPTFVMLSSLSQTALLNGFVSIFVAAVTTFLLSRVLIAEEHSRKFDIDQIQTGSIAGAVAVGTVVDRGFGPGGAALMAMLGSVLSVVFTRFVTPKLSKLRFYQDTRGVLQTSLLPGLLSGLASIVIFVMVNEDVFNNDDGSGFPREDRQPGYQLGAIIVCLIAGIIGGGICGVVLKFGKRIGFLNGDDAEKYEDESYWTHASGPSTSTSSGSTAKPAKGNEEEMSSV